MTASARLEGSFGPERWRGRCYYRGCFVGPNRKTEAAAQKDADRHNRKEHPDD